MNIYIDFLANNEIICLSISLNDVKIEDLGRFTFNNVKESLQKLREIDGIEECLILQKCNCVEIYAIGRKEIKEELIEFWEHNSNKFDGSLIDKIHVFRGEKVFEHLLKTGCGLKSLLIGDAQVLGQIRMARKIALEIGTIGTVLDTVFNYVRKVDNRVRIETNFHKGYTSIERSVVDIIKRNFSKKCKISIIGLGQTGELILKSLMDSKFSNITISNRTLKTAERLKKKYNTKIEFFENYLKLLSDSDLVIFATNSPKYLINKEDIKLFRKDLSIIDIGNPPNVNPLITESIINLDNIKKNSTSTLENRMKEVPKVNKIIFEELDKLKHKIELSLINKDISKNISSFDINNSRDNYKTIFILRCHIINYIREFLKRKGFIEVQTPFIMTIPTDPVKNPNEELFQVKWYGKRAFLRQSVQLHKQMLIISGFDKIFEIGPFWRAEKKQTKRHLSEAWSLDVEMKNIKNHYNIMEILEELICYVINQLRRKDNKYLKTLNINLNTPKSFPHISYDNAIMILNENNIKISNGEDIGVEREYKLYEILKKKFGERADLFFVENYPNTIKKFYTKPLDNKLTRTFDLIFKGWELSSGAQRETDYEKIIDKMKMNNLKIKKYNFYLNMFKNNDVPNHGGFGMGLDRFIAKLLNLEDVTQVVLFPRTQHIFVP